MPEGITMSPPRRTRPHRIALDISADQYDWLADQRVQDRVSSADRLRALIELCREDELLCDRVISKATELAQAQRKGGAP